MPAADAALLWADAFQRLADRAAHEIRSPLNGAALNIEVVRSRLERGGTELSKLSPFAQSASEELERAIRLVEAILGLARSTPYPVDLLATLTALVTITGVIARSEGGQVSLERTGDETMQTSVDANAVRGALATALDSAVKGGARVHCKIGHSDGKIAIQIETKARDELPADFYQSVRAAGIVLEYGSAGMTLLFSPA